MSKSFESQVSSADTTSRAMQAGPEMLEVLREIVKNRLEPLDSDGYCYFCYSYHMHIPSCPITRAREIVKRVDGGK